jgi:hypothetical protein
MLRAQQILPIAEPSWNSRLITKVCILYARYHLYGNLLFRPSLGGEDWTVYQGPVPHPGQPPCHSKRTKIAVITARSSGTE